MSLQAAVDEAAAKAREVFEAAGFDLQVLVLHAAVEGAQGDPWTYTIASSRAINPSSEPRHSLQLAFALNRTASELAAEAVGS